MKAREPFFPVFCTVTLTALFSIGAGNGFFTITGPDTVDVGAYSRSNAPIAVFSIANTGKESLRLIRVVSTCHCLAVAGHPDRLTPGEKGKLVVSVNTDVTEGSFCSTVMIETDSVLTPFSHVTVKSQMPWNRTALYQTPRIYDATGYATNRIRTLFYEGEPYRGKSTRVFAYVGMPAAATRGEKVPGIVLVHGGGGSAFYRWVKLWNDRGYAAISMDTCGCVSGNVFGNEQQGHRRHDWAGPMGWGAFRQADEPETDQWAYHAVAAVVRANSLLRSLPDVDAERIGITGISWGGYLTCLATGVDDRFRFAVPVYGCGFLGENSVWRENGFDGATPEQGKKWISLWDPMHVLPYAKTPFLWVDGSNDFAYPLDSVQKSYRALSVPYQLCIRLRMPHGHGAAGENPAEIPAFAEQMVHNGPVLPRFMHVTRNHDRVSATFTSGGMKVVRAVLNYTCDAGKWQKRRWKEMPATIHKNTVSTGLPPDVTVYYLNLITETGLVVSSDHEERK